MTAILMKKFMLLIDILPRINKGLCTKITSFWATIEFIFICSILMAIFKNPRKRRWQWNCLSPYYNLFLYGDNVELLIFHEVLYIWTTNWNPMVAILKAIQADSSSSYHRFSYYIGNHLLGDNLPPCKVRMLTSKAKENSG